MNRKQKIIVSITGIILVSLILIGLTYAYFLTRITGNTNDKSISVTTANLILEYGENTKVIQGISNAEPGYSVEKIFTATNKGNSSVTYGAALEDIVNELSRQQDLVYTLTCTSYLKEGFNLSSNGTITGTVDGDCSGVTTETKFPSTSTLSIMTTNTIDTTHTHAYKLTVTYKEMGEDQSVDMNKTFSAKVNIVDLRANADKINPYSANKQALNYQIINSALEGGTNKTYYASVERLIYSTGTTSITTIKPTFKCAESATNDYSRFTVNASTLLNGNKTNGNLTYPVGLLTADEVAYAGAYKYYQTNKTYYLYNSSISSYWWLSSPYSYNVPIASEWYVDYSNGYLASNDVDFTLAFRPSINLKAETLKNAGDGTKENPYIILIN